MHLTRGMRYGGLALSTLLVLAACEDASVPTAPANDGGAVVFAPRYESSSQITPIASVPQSRPYPGTKVRGEATVCKDASSPAGSYTFNVSATNAQVGDLVATSVTLSPGQCSIVYNRTSRRFANSRVAVVTVTEIIPSDATYRLDRVIADDDFGDLRTVAGPSVALSVNAHHGGSRTSTT